MLAAVGPRVCRANLCPGAVATHVPFRIKDFTTHQLSAVAENVVPPTLGLPWYILSTLMLVSWPYRLWFTSITGRKSFTFVKQVNMHAY